MASSSSPEVQPEMFCYLPSLMSSQPETFARNEYHSTFQPLPSQSPEWLQSRPWEDACVFAFALLLKAYVGTNDIVFGLRADIPDREDAIPQVVRIQLDPTGTLLSNLQSLSKTSQVEVPSQSETEHGLLKNEQPPEEPTRTFNTYLLLTNSGAKVPSTSDLGECDVILCMEPHDPGGGAGDGFKASINYSTRVLDEWSAQNLLETLENIILKVVLANKDGLLDHLELLSPRDEDRINAWNATLPPPANRTLNECFEKVFAENMGRELVWTSAGTFTYGEVDKLSTVLALRLRKLGVQRGSIVPICMDKSRWATCAMVAVWKAGGALSTMDPSYPDLRLLDMIAALDANIVITDPRNALRFQSNTTHVVSDMENLPELLGQAEYMIGPVEAWSMGDVQPDDLAFVAWTSGSSGKPKGVLHTHDRLTSEHQSYEWNHEYNDNARILQFGSYAYIAGVGDNFRTMLHGATLCVPSETERTSALAQFINRSKSTRSYMTPSVLRTLDPAEVPSLKHLCIGGEPIDRDLERLWSRHVHFLSLYGASEGCFMIKQASHPQYRSIGLRSIGGLSWLVDPDDINKLVPIGALGEIVFESHELATGYLNDPEGTAKAFIDTPPWARTRSSSRPPRFLRMGDLGKYEVDGSMTIFGRRDTQIKIDGQRVDLQDVETNLRSELPTEARAVVELVEPFDSPGRPLLVAFVSVDREDENPQDLSDPARVGAIQVPHVLAELAKLLPRHMVPRAFIFLDRLPGDYKIDRKKLRTDAGRMKRSALLRTALPDDDKPSDPVVTNSEMLLASMWSSVLQAEVETIGRRDSFVALGGDSIAAIRLVSLARSASLELTTQQIMMLPILQDMAAAAGTRRAQTDKNLGNQATLRVDGLITTKATDFQAWAAAVGAQNGGWIDHFAYDFIGPLDIRKLGISCMLLVDAHPILGSFFTKFGETIYINFPAKNEIPLETHECTHDELEEKSKALFARERVSPLGRPISRFDLITVSPDRHRLILRISHAQYDGFCAAFFGEHLQLLYRSDVPSLPSRLPYLDYLSQIQDPEMIARAETYWRNHLMGSSIPELVRHRLPPPSLENTLDGELKSQISVPRLHGQGIHASTVVKAAWALLLCALTDTNDVVFGDFIFGRQIDIPGVETVVGPCVSFMPVRVTVAPTTTRLALLRQMQSDAISAIPHQSLGHTHIIEKCTSWGPGARYSSIVNFLGTDYTDSDKSTWVPGDEESDGLTVESIYEEQQHDKTDLWLLCVPQQSKLGADPQSPSSAGKFEISLRYSTNVYSAEAIAQITAQYVRVLESLTTMLDSPVSIPEISPSARSSMIPSL